MIRMIQSTSASHAKAYFADALLKSDYYTNDQELQGKFEGRLAERLGLKGTVTKEAFFALCENRNPQTDKNLTPITKEERTTGYDINFHCPKSISILHSLANDDHILEVFQQSVTETMQDIEADAQTRVRKEGKYEDRQTDELVWSKFVHQTARPVEDYLPDPHLHAHCYVFNMTWDKEENKFKAAKFRDIKRTMPYYQARFQKRLADKMAELGYKIRPTGKSFEIEGVPQKVIDLFSKRTDEIGRIAKEKGITDAKELDGLGARTRSKKQKGLSMAELKAGWRRQIQDLGPLKEEENNAPVRFDPKKQVGRHSPQQCLEHAIEHCFERASVIEDRRLLETAYRFALGNHTVTLEDITKQFERDSELLHIKEGRRHLCTTKEVLTEEKQMVTLARRGQGKLVPLYQKAPEMKLKDQQAAAVQHVLTTKNRVSIIRGAAGSGKTTLMREAVDLIEEAGKQVIVVAPTAQASRGVLKEEGFDKAETVAKLLVDQKLQDQLEGQVLWIDEAGLIGTGDMKKILELVTKKNARLILGGDTRQHASVVRGDALRILNKVAGIRTAEVSKIYRQKDTQYREAVENLSKGEIKKGFDKLDKMGAIKEANPQNPNEVLVKDYIKAVKKGKSALVISPTHKQGEQVTEEIRTQLRQEGLIGKKEITVERLVNTNMTAAEKSDWRNFSEGQIVQFNQNISKIKRGSAWLVKAIKDRDVELADENNNTVLLPRDKAKQYDVFQKKEMKLAKGDKIQITRNGFDKKERRLNNGQTLEVISVSKKGNVVVKNKVSKATYVLDKDYGHLNHAHCITSHASQGKTVDEVFIAQPSGTFGATDAKQFYVSVSRGREAVSIYTDDRAGLLEYASELGERQSAIELVAFYDTHEDYVHHNQREAYNAPDKDQEREKIGLKRDKERNYEPGL